MPSEGTIRAIKANRTRTATNLAFVEATRKKLAAKVAAYDKRLAEIDEHRFDL
jgi:hypothetical protein